MSIGIEKIGSTVVKFLSPVFLVRFSEFDKHKAVWRLEDKETGLRGFVAIHNENLGPAVGGTRYWKYKNEKEALEDALRLSKAMSYKCALVGVKFGGGKGVIIASSLASRVKEGVLKSYASVINYLKGRFFTGEDVGLTQNDVDYLKNHCAFIIGGREKSGDPSPWAARSVFYSMKAATSEILHKNLSRSTVAIKGLGKVGKELCRLLIREGVKVVGADINPMVIKSFTQEFPSVRTIEPSEIQKQKVDVYSPCALGQEFTSGNISKLRCRIICGGANNQLVSANAGSALSRRKIFYVPDYLANSGGLINVIDELEDGGYNRQRVARRVRAVYDKVKKLICVSLSTSTSPDKIVDELVLNTLYEKIRENS